MEKPKLFWSTQKIAGLLGLDEYDRASDGHVLEAIRSLGALRGKSRATLLKVSNVMANHEIPPSLGKQWNVAYDVLRVWCAAFDDVLNRVNKL
jgi:hypothetical protein